jgi:hypothetical protein
MLEFAWRKALVPMPELDPDYLIQAAMRLTGQPAADGCWRERLEILTHALSTEASLNSLGQVIAHGQLVMALKHRLRWQALWRRHPDIAEFPIKAPILIVGHMRSGTTRMQRLLACDPRLMVTRFFESWTPFSDNAASGLDLRPMRAWLGLRFAHLLNPEFRYIHPVDAMQADEEIGLQSISIAGAAFEAQWRVPSFAAHIEAADARPIYDEFKRLLQTVGWLRRDRPRPWVLKLPQFTQDLDAVLATFPDARIIRLDRDPVDVVASSASLVHNQMSLQSDAIDPAGIGREWLRKTCLREARMQACLARASAPQVEVSFEALNAGWKEELARIYQTLGLSWDARVEQRMGDFLAASRHKKLARHRYHLAAFDLSPREVHQAFAKSGRQDV